MTKTTHCGPRRREKPARGHLAALLVLLLLAAGPALAGDQQWSGDGPSQPGAGSRTVNTLVINPATGTLFAGTDSGTVFAYSDETLVRPPSAGSGNGGSSGGGAGGPLLLATLTLALARTRRPCNRFNAR